MAERTFMNSKEGGLSLTPLRSPRDSQYRRASSAFSGFMRSARASPSTVQSAFWRLCISA
jgi:hypothetical protein